MYSFQKLCPVCSATWLSDAHKPKKFRKNVICMVQYEVCWPVGSASTGAAPQQLAGSPFKYLNEESKQLVYLIPLAYSKDSAFWNSRYSSEQWGS